MKKTDTVLIGIGGFGNQYVRGVLDDPRAKAARVVGACDPRPEGCDRLAELKALGVPVFSNPQEMFAHVQADLAVISTPIFLHAEHAALAFANGCDVLLEKPIAATAEETAKIIASRDESGKQLAIGFQWCYDEAMKAFKADILSGRFGKLVHMQAMVLWPRDLAYYARGGGWAGKRLSADGRPLWDSVASNATAHYIMNMLWLAGETPGAAAQLQPERVWTGHANEIETFDSVAFTGKIGSAEVLYCASHAVGPQDTVNPVFRYEFERGEAVFSEDEGGELTVRLHDGSCVHYGRSVPNGANIEKLFQVLEACQSGDWSSLPCPAEAALRHAQAMDSINRTPAQDLRPLRALDEARNAWVVPGLGDWLKTIYATGVLPASFSR
ncbi:MAG: Gfo/Idh/MocA family oxidoreductase [Clostridia bacterium]|nr:Gfo/Idh/MocA family oxidoreductase [Clostridia bacterium]